MNEPATPSASARPAAILAGAFVVIYAGVFIGAFATHYWQLVHDLTETLKAIVLIVAGFYFGSSYGSQIKTAFMGAKPANANDPAPARAAADQAA